MIFFMQAGFALVECGSVREKNATSILMKNLFDACAGCVGWWLVGYGFAYGDVNGGFIGYNPKYFATSGFEDLPFDNYLRFIFEFSFAATAASIVAGSLAERTQLITYIIFSFLMTSFIYPVVVHWVWGGGWLQQQGFYDFAGVACVHLVGGTAALWGAVLVGERYGKEKARKAQRQSMIQGEHERS